MSFREQVSFSEALVSFSVKTNCVAPFISGDFPVYRALSDVGGHDLQRGRPRKGSEIGRAWERQAEGVGAGCLKKPPKRMHHPLNQVITTRGRTSRKSRSTQQAVTGQA